MAARSSHKAPTASSGNDLAVRPAQVVLISQATGLDKTVIVTSVKYDVVQKGDSYYTARGQKCYKLEASARAANHCLADASG